MSLPFEIRFDKNVFKTAMYVSGISIGGVLLISVISLLFEGKLFSLVENWNFIGVFISQLELLSIFLIPMFVAVFVRPLSRKRKDLLIQGCVILLVSSLIYFALVSYAPQLDIYPFEKRGHLTNTILLGIFLIINLAIYSPSLLRKEKPL